MLESLANELPTAVLCILFIVPCILLSWAGLYFFNKVFRNDLLEKNHDVSGIVFGAVSLIYSLVLAFVIVAVWQDYEDLNTTIENEADELHYIAFHATQLSDSNRSVVQNFVQQYAQLAMRKDWLLNLKNGRDDQKEIVAFRHQLLHMQSRKDSDEATIGLLQNYLTDLGDYRRDCSNHSESHVPGLVWMVLITGSIVTIVASFFLFVQSKRLQYLFTAVLTGMIAMSMFLVFMLDHPFLGSSQVSAEPFKEIYQEMTEK